MSGTPREAGLFVGKNLMTPDRIEDGWLVPGVLGYEISSGEGLFTRETVYGLTFQRTDRRYSNGDPRPMLGLSDLEYSMALVRRRLARVRRLVAALVAPMQQEGSVNFLTHDGQVDDTSQVYDNGYATVKGIPK